MSTESRANWDCSTKLRTKNTVYNRKIQSLQQTEAEFQAAGSGSVGPHYAGKGAIVVVEQSQAYSIICDTV